MTSFKANLQPVLIGSIPMEDHENATDFILKYTPEIPLWVQLPIHKEEGMISQFIPGMPGVVENDDKIFIDSQSEKFEMENLSFYEDYLMITEGGADISDSRFALTENSAKGFFELLKKADKINPAPLALKGQITGPITFATGLTDMDDRAIFYDDLLRDIAIKHLSMKAKWQTKFLKSKGFPAIVFFDEPALAGFGSSAFLTITQEDVTSALDELCGSVHSEGGLAGVHVCANTEWPVLFNSKIDIISFDAYGYFDKFILFADQIKAFMERGGIIAWGIVPTLGEIVDIENADSLINKWKSQAAQLETAGIPKDIVKAQTLITPSCGTGTLSIEQAEKVLGLCRTISDRLNDGEY